MKLGVVIPCYNEEDVLLETTERIYSLLKEMIKNQEIDKDSFVCYIDDGSKDKT